MSTRIAAGRRPRCARLAAEAFVLCLLLLGVPAAGAAQDHSATRPPKVTVPRSHDLSLGVASASWEGDLLRSDAGPAILIRRRVAGPVSARFALATFRADVALGGAATPARLYAGLVGVGLAPIVPVAAGVALRPGVHAAGGTTVTAPDSDILAERSQNTWAVGGSVDLIYRDRWTVAIEYERVEVRLEDPAAEGLSEGRPTSSDTFVFRVGLRF